LDPISEYPKIDYCQGVTASRGASGRRMTWITTCPHFGPGPGARSPKWQIQRSTLQCAGPWSMINCRSTGHRSVGGSTHAACIATRSAFSSPASDARPAGPTDCARSRWLSWPTSVVCHPIKRDVRSPSWQRLAFLVCSRGRIRRITSWTVFSYSLRCDFP